MADPSPASPSFFDSLLKWWPVLLFILGGLVNQLWTSYRNRTRKFTWRAWHNQIAMAANNPALGNVTVQHNGVNVNQIHATSVEFRNESNADVTNVLVTLSFQGVGHVIDTMGSVDQTPLYLDDAYMAQLINAANNPAQAQILNSAIVYRVPVLNRRKRAVFHMLVHRDDLSAPIVVASCNYAGFRLEEMKQHAMIFGVSRNAAVYTGLLITAPIVALLWRFHHPYVNGALAYILGLTVAVIGAYVVKTAKLLDRIFG